MDNLSSFQDTARKLWPALADIMRQYYEGEIPDCEGVEVQFSCEGRAKVPMSQLCQLSPMFRMSAEGGPFMKVETLQISMPKANYELIQDLWLCLLSPQKLPKVADAPVMQIIGLTVDADRCQVCQPVIDYLAGNLESRLDIATCVAIAHDDDMGPMPKCVMELLLPTLLDFPAALGGVVANEQIALELKDNSKYATLTGVIWSTRKESMDARLKCECVVVNGERLVVRHGYEAHIEDRVTVNAMVPLNAHCIVLHCTKPEGDQPNCLVCVDTRTGVMLGSPRPVNGRLGFFVPVMVANSVHLFVNEGDRVAVLPLSEAVFAEPTPPAQYLHFDGRQALIKAISQPIIDALVLWFVRGEELVVYQHDSRDDVYTERYRIASKFAVACSHLSVHSRVFDGLWLRDTRLLILMWGDRGRCSLQLLENGQPEGNPYCVGFCSYQYEEPNQLLAFKYGRIYYMRNSITAEEATFLKPEIRKEDDFQPGMWVFDDNLTRLSIIPYPNGATIGALLGYGSRLLVMLDLTDYYLYDPATSRFLPGHLKFNSSKKVAALKSGAIALVGDRGEIGVLTRAE